MRRTTMGLALLLAACGSDPDGAAPITAVRLPQAQAGAMQVDPQAYATIPVRVEVDGDASSVVVQVGEEIYPAFAERDGSWLADLPVGARADGDLPVQARAVGLDGESAAATATLVVAAGGVRRTVFDVDGMVTTPRLHRHGDRLLATWIEGDGGPRRAWLAELDGAGREVGDRIALFGDGVKDVVYARAAIGTDTVGLYVQRSGTPFRNFFTVVGLADGAERLAPIALEPEGRTGSYGADVAFADGAYHVAWRTQASASSLDVRALTVDEATLTVTGPVQVADTGDGMPHGGFDNIAEIGVRAAGGASLVTFARYEYDASLDLEVPRCHVARVVAGVAEPPVQVAIGGGLHWHLECRLRDLGGVPVMLWTANDLLSADDNPPADVYALRLEGGVLPEARGNGSRILTAPRHRSEPALVTTSAAPILAWTDERTYVDPLTGRIELRAAPLGDDLTAGSEVVFPAARMLSGGTDVHGAPIGENAVIGWIDQRTGGNVLAPRPEIYFTTVWQ